MAARSATCPPAATERQCQSGASCGASSNQRDTYCVPVSTTVSPTGDAAPVRHGARATPGVSSHGRSRPRRDRRRRSSSGPSRRSFGRRPPVRRRSEQCRRPAGPPAPAHSPPVEGTPQRALEQRPGAGVRPGCRTASAAASRGELHSRVGGCVDGNRAERREGFSPARHESSKAAAPPAISRWRQRLCGAPRREAGAGEAGSAGTGNARGRSRARIEPRAACAASRPRDSAADDDSLTGHGRPRVSPCGREEP